MGGGRLRLTSGSFEGRRRRTGLWLVAPALLVLLGVLAYPIAASLLLGFQDATIAGGGVTSEWIGLANYQRMLADPTFGIALRNSLYFTFVEVILVIGLGLLLALCGCATPAQKQARFEQRYAAAKLQFYQTVRDQHLPSATATGAEKERLLSAAAAGTGSDKLRPAKPR